MLKAYATGFYKIAIDLERMRVFAGVSAAKSKINSVTQADFEKVLASMKVECKNLELNHTLSMVLSIESNYRNKVAETDSYFSKGYTESDLFHDLDTLNMSFINELGSDLIFRIAPSKIDYFEKDDLFGAEVTISFPSAVEDVRNAGTCFAVEQWDASVFHLMRVLERGLRVLATKFNIPFQNTTWNTIIQDIETNIGGINPSFGADWREQRTFYSETARHFRFLKDAWRNHIMHLGDAYDEGRALSVLRHVHELTQTLAKGGLHE